MPALLDLVEQTTDVWTKRRAIQALGQIGDPQATDLLINALEDPDHAVRQNAILSLGWLGGPKAVGPLTEILKAPEIDFGHSAPLLGQTLDVLIEGHGDDLSVGRSYRDAPEIDGLVLVQAELPVGQIQHVHITAALEYDLFGKPAE